jgi:hypothetical protein
VAICAPIYNDTPASDIVCGASTAARGAVYGPLDFEVSKDFDDAGWPGDKADPEERKSDDCRLS